jgi:hypothetical protein
LYSGKQIIISLFSCENFSLLSRLYFKFQLTDVMKFL